MSNAEKQLHWGILGNAKIARNAVIPAIQNSNYGTVSAIASRNRENAEAYAKTAGIKKVYSDYETLLSDPKIDAVYIPLPNHLHSQWCIQAVEQGKHVLCEKPIALSLEEIDRLIKARNRSGKLISEAFMVASHPQWEAALALKEEGAIGELRGGQGSFTYFNIDANNIRNRYSQGGGGLWDIGVYPIFTSRRFFREKPNEVYACIEYDQQFGVDRIASGILYFPSGQFSFYCSTQACRFQEMRFFGSKGVMDLPTPFNPSKDEDSSILLRGEKAKDSFIKEIPAVDQYLLQADNFAQAVFGERELPVDLEDSRINTEIILALFESAEKGRRIELS